MKRGSNVLARVLHLLLVLLLVVCLAVWNAAKASAIAYSR